MKGKEKGDGREMTRWQKRNNLRRRVSDSIPGWGSCGLFLSFMPIFRFQFASSFTFDLLWNSFYFFALNWLLVFAMLFRAKWYAFVGFFFFMSTTNLLKYARSISFMIESRESVLLMIYAFPPSRALMPGAAALGGSKMSPIPLP